LITNLVTVPSGNSLSFCVTHTSWHVSSDPFGYDQVWHIGVSNTHTLLTRWHDDSHLSRVVTNTDKQIPIDLSMEVFRFNINFLNWLQVNSIIWWSTVKIYHDLGLFHFHRVTYSVQLKSRVVLTLTKSAGLRIMLNIDGATITSKSHTHPSHSQTYRLLTSCLSLCVPVPRTTQCLRGV
jgi:hypothetical protein